MDCLALTSFSIPYFGNVVLFVVHEPQNTCPQALQWCLRCIKLKVTRHLWHISPLAHSGAVSAENMASVSRCGGNL